jgi:diadenosine tetraphosphatase ApaH/serine/threonine PP2A family protein phosphatase
MALRRAILSDIHANLEALEAVLDDIKAQGIQEIYCLGDIIGYGPNPRECIDLAIQRFKVCLMGNHDQAAVFDPEGFNAAAERAIFWTRAQLETRGDARQNEKRWEFLGELPAVHREGEFLYVHGSPRIPLNEYIFPEDIYNRRKMESLFSRIDKYCFVGHTHVPGIFLERGVFLEPADLKDKTFTLGDEKVIVNVGSVGQPRDGDPRACYVILDDGKIQFRRVEYDMEKTIRKIYEIPELDRFSADRLREGR